MKTLLMTAILAITIASCNKTTKESENDTIETSVNSNEVFACPMHPEVTGKKGEDCSKCGMELTEPVAQAVPAHNHNEETHQQVDTTKQPVKEIVETKTAIVPFSIDEIVTNYLKIKNALTKDDATTAANAGKSLFKVFAATSTTSLTANQKKAYLDIVADAKEHAEHIGDNAGKIDHQREHFEALSTDMTDLVALLGTDKVIYQDYCPMANNNKGANWLSEVKEIKNPYFGSKMLKCGSVKKQIN